MSSNWGGGEHSVSAVQRAGALVYIIYIVALASGHPHLFHAQWPRAIWLGVLLAFAMDACPSGSPGGVLTSSQNAAWRYDVAPNPSGVSLSTPPLLAEHGDLCANVPFRLRCGPSTRTLDVWHRVLVPWRVRKVMFGRGRLAHRSLGFLAEHSLNAASIGHSAP